MILDMKLTMWLACLAVGSVLLTGCSSADAGEPAGTTEGTTSSTSTDRGEEGSMEMVEYRNADGKLVCPLMNSVIEDESTIKGWVEHDGKKYAMCCDVCAKKGKEEPALVAQKAAENDKS